MVLDQEDLQPASRRGLHIAFRPIYDIAVGRVFAYEAMLRSTDGEDGDDIFEQLPRAHHAELDRRVAIASVHLAMTAGLDENNARLLIPIHAAKAAAPGASLAAAAEAGRRAGLPAERLIFAVHGYGEIPGQHLADLVEGHRRAGSLTAFVGLGHDPVGFSPCVRYRPEMVRLDRELVTGIDNSWSRRLMLEELTPKLRDHGMRVIADGVESDSALRRLRSWGIFHVQGDLVAPPVAGMLPPSRITRPTANA
ncbi:EAL domain-containing protein [Sphingomonas pokkalii]|uniref:EAL domain-containing protein n=1 Tax=Sphingomonas pokkalii TaxID=2175090 RepID=A0A2U0SC52_9SPHN|nr:EAL domain-containing protein [Sphingomonas pokkalii]PVX28956.1 EAL domain-containing protein [Sphingomonas pokkalii]